MKILFIKIGLWLVKIENMICENMKTLQSTLVQKGGGGDVDWPFWVQQVQISPHIPTSRSLKNLRHLRNLLCSADE